MSNYLVLSHLKVKNANALSSPISIGVPSVTAFLGATHKLQRYLNANGYDKVKVTGVGIIIHDASLRTFSSVMKFESLIEQGKPLTRKGERPSGIPDPKIDFTVSLICDIEDENFDIYNEEDFLSKVDIALSSEVRIAGGEILSPRIKGSKATSSFKESNRIKYFPGIEPNNPSEIRALKRILTPGYVLIERRELLEKEMEAGKDPIEAIVDYLAIHHDCKKNDEDEVKWTRRRKTAGWLVPISVGYQGLSKPEIVENQRDNNYLHVFGENLVTLGEYKIINSIQNLNEIIWKYKTDLDKQLYLCTCNGGN